MSAGAEVSVRAEAALAAPVNALERERDPGGRWRRAVNGALAGAYAQLFAPLDRLVLLAAPGFEIVRTWTPPATYPGREDREQLRLLRRV